jgi:CubicO group peptidase (beta-lactamase class C family)
MRRWWRPLTAVVAVVALAGAAWAGLAASTSRSQLARAIMWRESDMDDHRRFPARRVAAGSERFRFEAAPAGAGTPPAAVRRVSVRDGDRLVERDLEQFLAGSDTTAFLIVRGDTLLYEGYFNGAGHDSVQTSMSMAKSVLSALVGIAIGEGRIGSVEDPITRYVPELAERDRRFGQITLRHLLTMTSGLRYEESGGPWGDDTATYYAPDLRALALRETEVVEEPGRRFRYNIHSGKQMV